MAVSQSRATRVLIGDDDAVIGVSCAVCSNESRTSKWSPFVSDGARALALARILDPDVLVLDELMPGVRGSEVARALANEGPSVCVVIYTADESAHDRVRAVAA